MKASEIKDMSQSDLIDKLEVETKSLHKMKFSHGLSQVENPLVIREKRRLIARLKTEVSARIAK
jgi:large subunit ribosomal protein L29